MCTFSRRVSAKHGPRPRHVIWCRDAHWGNLQVTERLDGRVQAESKHAFAHPHCKVLLARFSNHPPRLGAAGLAPDSDRVRGPGPGRRPTGPARTHPPAPGLALALGPAARPESFESEPSESSEPHSEPRAAPGPHSVTPPAHRASQPASPRPNSSSLDSWKPSPSPGPGPGPARASAPRSAL